jgi:sugar O-acyltransferase (sialic acid O-acetyltransferase NeuD family)
MQRLALIGGGGFAKEVMGVGHAAGFRIEDYYADRPGSIKLKHCGYLEDLERNKAAYDGVMVAVGAVNRQTIAMRRVLIDWLDQREFKTPTLVSPHAIVSKSVKLGAGTYVAHVAVVSEDAVVGRFGLINTGALIGHDTILGENVTISSLAFIGGGTTVGDDTLIGATARVLQGARIGKEAIVGMGCTVLRKVNDQQTILPSLR